MAQICEVPIGVLRVTPRDFPDPAEDLVLATGDHGEATVVLGGGCFWCIEAVFQPVEGVLSVVSGYAGGSADTADYRTVCSGRTGHAEVVQIRFDPQRVSYGQILKLFFSIAHDPTQLNRQGNDRGTQYRSAIFYADDTEMRIARNYIRQLEEARVFTQPIVTTLEPLDVFYPAETYHQDYVARNPHQPYVAFIAKPKIKKLQDQFPDRLKASS